MKHCSQWAPQDESSAETLRGSVRAKKAAAMDDIKTHEDSMAGYLKRGEDAKTIKMLIMVQHSITATSKDFKKVGRG